MLAVLGALFAIGLNHSSQVYRCCYDGLVRNDDRVAALAYGHPKPGVLATGFRVYERPASDKHPFGYGKERFFWSFIAPSLFSAQILINALVNLRDDLILGDVLQTNEDIEALIKRADPKVEMIFLESVRASKVRNRTSCRSTWPEQEGFRFTER